MFCVLGAAAERGGAESLACTELQRATNEYQFSANG